MFTAAPATALIEMNIQAVPTVKRKLRILLPAFAPQRDGWPRRPQQAAARENQPGFPRNSGQLAVHTGNDHLLQARLSVLLQQALDKGPGKLCGDLRVDLIARQTVAKLRGRIPDLADNTCDEGLIIRHAHAISPGCGREPNGNPFTGRLGWNVLFNHLHGRPAVLFQKPVCIRRYLVT
ncbi:hypothetical protein [Paracoccus seriniphilus]|uniref:hypothetical protein n=1 Tax=Paracoccus seriniphilus TaxID=184748 RepID=UPI003565D9FD